MTKMRNHSSVLTTLVLATFVLISFVAIAKPKDAAGATNDAVKSAAVAAPQPLDEGYTAKIREYTTAPYFTTELVDHLPASPTVPSPEKILGYVIGAPNKLTYTKDIYRYLRALAAASPRVKLFTVGKSEGGRDFVLAIVSDEANIRNLDRLKEITAKLADPRKLSDADADKLIAEGKPFYWLSGSIHSPETGSPEMLMEIAYRLAVEETPYIQNIRKNAVVMITPVLEVDGRDREVDVYNYTKANPDKQSPGLIYWGNYVQHDNNRDSMGLGLALSKEQLKTFLEYHPQVLHDLHESEPFLYASTGTGPYNSWFDPMTIDEWHELAYYEIENFTARGVPGVWTHGFFDGWAPNGMMMTTANAHNSIGRFYETFGNGGADTRDRTLGAAETSIEWFRPNPPLSKFKWSMRDNTNYEESGALFALTYTANNASDFLHSFYVKSKRAVAKSSTEGPAAWAIVNDGKRPGLAAQLARLFQEQGAEVQKLNQDVHVSEPMPAMGGAGGRGGRGGRGMESQSAPAEAPAQGGTAAERVPAGPRKQDIAIPAGSYIIRMDQPYSRVADMMLDTQYFNVSDPTPYDDTGWTFGPLRNVKTQRITDAGILNAPMTLITAEIHAPGGISGTGAKFFLINATAEPALATLRFRLKDVKMNAAEDSFQSGGKNYNAGTFIVPAAGNPGDLKSQLDKAAAELGVRVEASDSDISVAQHAIGVPRIALVHTWQSTQQEGWFRLALEETGIPYSYISIHTIRDTPNLREKYDVILFPPSSPSAAALINGVPKRFDADGNEIGGPIPWKKTDLTPNLGTMDSTDDIRGGLELEGVANLRKFINDGGVFIPITSTSSLPIDTGLTSGISIAPTRALQARGSVYSATIDDKRSPIAYGYDDTLGVYFSQAPVFRVSLVGGGFGGGGGGGPAGENGARPSGRGTASDSPVPQGQKWDPPAPEPQRSRAEQELYVNPELPRSMIPPPQTWPRVVVRFANAQNLLISGMLAGGQELAEAPAVVDVPSGRGHVVFFAINPMWRQETHGSFMLVLNAALNFDHLNAGRKPPTPNSNSNSGEVDDSQTMPGHQSH
jgi:hypothetical protein